MPPSVEGFPNYVVAGRISLEKIERYQKKDGGGGVESEGGGQSGTIVDPADGPLSKSRFVKTSGSGYQRGTGRMGQEEKKERPSSLIVTDIKEKQQSKRAVTLPTKKVGPTGRHGRGGRKGASNFLTLPQDECRGTKIGAR